MAAAGVEFGTRVTRGRNRTNEGVIATMRLLLDAGADINARMVTEARRVVPEGAAYRAAAVGRAGRGSQVPSASAVPHETLHGAAERGFTALVKFAGNCGSAGRMPAGQAARSCERCRRARCSPAAGSRSRKPWLIECHGARASRCLLRNSGRQES